MPAIAFHYTNFIWDPILDLSLSGFFSSIYFSSFLLFALHFAFSSLINFFKSVYFSSLCFFNFSLSRVPFGECSRVFTSDASMLRLQRILTRSRSTNVR